jgi:phosphatidylserine decarboxylase
LRIQGDAIQVTVKQIAGFIARRVVCWKSPGNPLKRGELIGLIRFGSRVDIVVPAQVNVRVQVGDLVKGGSSILGSWV